MSSNAVIKIDNGTGCSPESAAAYRDISFTAGEFSLVLTYPQDVKMPDEITRLITGIIRKLEEMARRRVLLEK